MFQAIKLSLLLVLSISYINGESTKTSYDGFKVYRIHPVADGHADILRNIQNDEPNHDFWTKITKIHAPVHIMVQPAAQTDFLNRLRKYGILVDVEVENVQELIDNEVIGDLKTSGKMTWTSYYTLSDLYDWFDTLEAENPGKVTVINAGKTHEDRDIKGVKISSGQGKKIVFIEGGIHAREWISPATATYIINEVLTSTDPKFRKIADSFDWHIIPSTNPDGYEYTHTTNRLWRKTRKNYGICTGADPNRNWDFKWGEFGTSTFSCAEDYGGPAPFSESETTSLASYLDTIGADTSVYLAFHSYSQYLLIPYATSAEHLDNYEDLYDIGVKAIANLESRYGTKYVLGTAAEILYEASGSSADWAKSNYGIPITYTYELRDTGKYGFILPADQIIPNCEEIMDSIITIFEEAEKKGYFTLG